MSFKTNYEIEYWLYDRPGELGGKTMYTAFVQTHSKEDAIGSVKALYPEARYVKVIDIF